MSFVAGLAWSSFLYLVGLDMRPSDVIVGAVAGTLGVATTIIVYRSFHRPERRLDAKLEDRKD